MSRVPSRCATSIGRGSALLGVHAADEEEVVVLLGRERLVLDVDRVRDGADEAQVGEALALVLGDGDEGEVVAQAAQHALSRLVRGAVQGGDDRRAGEPMDEGAHHPAVDTVVVVDDVELARPRVGLEALRDLEMHPVLDLLEGGALEERREARLGLGVAAGEQRHLVAALDEALGEQRDDELDAAVAARRQREPWRCDHPDPHGDDSTSGAASGAQRLRSPSGRPRPRRPRPRVYSRDSRDTCCVGDRHVTRDRGVTIAATRRRGQ